MEKQSYWYLASIFLTVTKRCLGSELLLRQGFPEQPQLLQSTRDGRIVMIEEKFSSRFMVLHTFVSDEARAIYCTPPEKREPKAERLSEYQWAV